MMIDLHLHSRFSDGLDSPAQLIDKAIELKLRAIALTDHDTIDGLREFLSYGENKNIIVIPGMEIIGRISPEWSYQLDMNSREKLKMFT